MPNPTIQAAGEAMPAESRVPLHIVDEIDTVRNLISAAMDAASTLPNSQGVDAVLLIAEDKLTAARDALNVARGVTPSDDADASDEPPAEPETVKPSDICKVYDVLSLTRGLFDALGTAVEHRVALEQRHAIDAVAYEIEEKVRAALAQLKNLAAP